MTNIYLHIFARMADYIATHPYYSNDPVPQPTIPSAKLWLLPMQ